jgi:hypothetical protein
MGMGSNIENSLNCLRSVMTITESKHALFHVVDLSAKIAVSGHVTTCECSRSLISSSV